MRLGNTITGGNSNGTYFGINEPNSGTASTADFFDFQNNGTIEAELSYQGILTAATWEGNKIGAAYGGTGSSSVPSSGQILVGNSSGTAYAPQTVSGDGSVTGGIVDSPDKRRGARVFVGFKRVCADGGERKRREPDR
jgi:hypothetical protein